MFYRDVFFYISKKLLSNSFYSRLFCFDIHQMIIFNEHIHFMSACDKK